MSLINRRPCPQCGVRERRNVTGRYGWYECLSCGLRYSFGNDPAGSEVYTESSSFTINGKELSLDNLDVNHWLRRLAWFTVIAAVVVGLGLWVSQNFRLWGGSLAIQQAVSMLGSTLYEGGGRQYFIRVFLREDSQPHAMQVVVDDFESGNRLAEPQRFDIQAGARPDWAQFRQYADGNLYLTLQNRQFLTFNAQTRQFTDLTPALQQQFASELGNGIESLGFQEAEWPDALRVRAGGKDFYVNWLARLLMPQDLVAQYFERMLPSYTAGWEGFAFFPDGEAQAGRAYLANFIGNGGVNQVRHLPQLALYPLERALESRFNDYQPIGNGFAIKTRDGKLPELIYLTPLPPMTSVKGGRVLAVNETRVLVISDSSAAGVRGAKMQLIDRGSKLPIWEQTLGSFPQLESSTSATPVQADGIKDGFYLRNGYAEPALMIDNQGQTLFDFTKKNGSESSQGLSWVTDFFK